MTFVERVAFFVFMVAIVMVFKPLCGGTVQGPLEQFIRKTYK